MMRFRRGGSSTSSKLESAPLTADFEANYSPRGVASPSYDFSKNRRKSDRASLTGNVGALPFGNEEVSRKKKSRRATSVGRASAESSRRRDGRSSRRAVSTGRATRRQRSNRKLVDREADRDPNVPRYVSRPHDNEGSSSVSQPELIVDASESNDYTDRTDDNPAIEEVGEKKKKSKMDKIRQLQAKNELYKTEFKRVQKDRKRLKKELETKKLEVDSLTKEIDSYISETSALKSKLSEALQQMDRTDQDDRRVSTEVSGLSSELETARVELKTARDRVEELTQEIEETKESIQRKDDQIKSLTRGITDETHQIEMLRNETVMLKRLHEQELHKEQKKQEELSNENAKLQSELGSTLDRAAAMVKEREDAIGDLLKENDNLKRMVGLSEAPLDADEEVNVLREKLSANAVALEEAEDRIVMLEDDINDWIRRGNEMEAEIVELREDAHSWQQKANTAQESKVFIAQGIDAKEKEVKAVKRSKEEMEARYKTQLAEMEIRLRAAQIAVEEKECASSSRSSSPHSLRSMSSTDSQEAPDVQAMSLERIVAEKKKKEAAKRAGWAFFGKPEEELDENQKRIRELEKVNDEQAEEVKKLKSEMVRLRSTYNEESYVNKKRIEKLETSNEEYENRIHELEKELNAAKAQFPDMLPASANNTA